MQGAGCRVQSAGCKVQGAGCGVQGVGCRVQGAGLGWTVISEATHNVKRLVSHASKVGRPVPVPAIQPKSDFRFRANRE